MIIEQGRDIALCVPNNPEIKLLDVASAGYFDISWHDYYYNSFVQKLFYWFLMHTLRLLPRLSLITYQPAFLFVEMRNELNFEA